jgi:Xaa-Pro dipeptidase
VKSPTELDEAVAAFLPLELDRSENALWAVLAHETFSHGALHAEARLLCWGPRTNPWNAGGDTLRRPER